MVKGHMENGKFHPHTQYKGVRKSRDQHTKTEGVKLQSPRMQRDEYPYQLEKSEPILETELTDIFDPITIKRSEKIDYDKLEHVVKSEIEYILEREKRLGKNEKPDVTLVELRPETSTEEFKKTGHGESGFYQYDFKIFKSGNITPFAGTAYGSISMGHVMDMSLELYDVRSTN